MSFRLVRVGEGFDIIDARRQAAYERILDVLRRHPEGRSPGVTFGDLKRILYPGAAKDLACKRSSLFIYQLATMTSDRMPRPPVVISAKMLSMYKVQRRVRLNNI